MDPRRLVWKAENWITAKGGIEFSVNGLGTTAGLAFFLGIFFGIGSGLFFLSPRFFDFGAFLCYLTLFHWTEFLLVAIYRSESLSGNSFLINHSVPYSIALTTCVVEYFVEAIYFPGLKGNWYTFIPGVIITTIGLAFRILAQHHAKNNFTHHIVKEKSDTHVLVTSGVYSISRHPGYFGWFWYTVGSQIILANPICFIGFYATSFIFFKTRISYEEKYLISFFGVQYENFKKKTRTWIPGIP